MNCKNKLEKKMYFAPIAIQTLLGPSEVVARPLQSETSAAFVALKQVNVLQN